MTTMGIVIVLIGLAIGFLIGAVFLRKAAKWVESLDVPFGEAYATVFISWLIGMGVGYLLPAIVFAIPTYNLSYMIGLLVQAIVICWLVQAGVICWRRSVTFGKALLISLVTVIPSAVLGFGTVAFIGFVILLSFLSSPPVLH